MNYLLIPIMMLCCLESCNSQIDAKRQAEKIQKIIKETRPGNIPSSTGGWTLSAKIDGKVWVASSIMPPETAGRLVGYHNEEYIGLPYDRKYFVVGKKIVFGENEAVDLATSDDIGLWGGRKGEMEITKVDGDWAEGKFYFTGSSSRSKKTIEVTDGFFRISLAKTP